MNKHFDYPIQFKSPVSVERIKKNVSILSKEDLPYIDFKEFNITLVVTSNEDDAYTFFETQNTGGVRLSGADIVKSHHLRAIDNSLLINKNAKDWEQLNHLTYVIDLMAKARFWNFLCWRNYPSFRKEKEIKDAIVDEFTERTLITNKDIAYRQVELVEYEYQKLMNFKDSTRSVRQPLFDGINTIQYFKEMVEYYESLFVSESDHRVPYKFYEFRNNLLKGWNGTIFLKELYEVATIMYVNKFGYSSLFEYALWSFRYIYSKRVTNDRTVREDSIFSFLQDRNNRILDIIANSFTHEQVIEYLVEFTYEFNNKNIDLNNVKGRFIESLSAYFSPDFKDKEKFSTNYDVILKKEINGKLK